MVFFILALLAGASPSAQHPAAQLAAQGWEALQAGRIQEAAAAFDRALTASPQQADTLLGAGAAAHLLGREDQARRLLVKAEETCLVTNSLKVQPHLDSVVEFGES